MLAQSPPRGPCLRQSRRATCKGMAPQEAWRPPPPPHSSGLPSTFACSSSGRARPRSAWPFFFLPQGGNDEEANHPWWASVHGGQPFIFSHNKRTLGFPTKQNGHKVDFPLLSTAKFVLTAEPSHQRTSAPWIGHRCSRAFCCMWVSVPPFFDGFKGKPKGKPRRRFRAPPPRRKKKK